MPKWFWMPGGGGGGSGPPAEPNPIDAVADIGTEDHALDNADAQLGPVDVGSHDEELSAVDLSLSPQEFGQEAHDVVTEIDGGLSAAAGSEAHGLGESRSTADVGDVGAEGQALADAITATASVDAGAQAEALGAARASMSAVEAGGEGQALTEARASLAPQEFGEEAHGLDATWDADLDVDAGGEGHVGGQVIDGTASASVGDEAQAVALDADGDLSADAGGSSHGAAFDSDIVATGYAGSGTNTGADNWSSTANALDADDDLSSISSSAGLVGGGHDGTLRLAAFAIDGTTPSGWTRDRVEVQIRHKWDITVTIGSSASYTVRLHKGDGTLLSTLLSASGSQAALLTETFDVSTAVSGLSSAELEALRVECQSQASFLVAGGNAGADVAWCHVVIYYSRSGIT